MPALTAADFVFTRTSTTVNANSREKVIRGTLTLGVANPGNTYVTGGVPLGTEAVGAEFPGQGGPATAAQSAARRLGFYRFLNEVIFLDNAGSGTAQTSQVVAQYNVQTGTVQLFQQNPSSVNANMNLSETPAAALNTATTGPGAQSWDIVARGW